MTVALDLDERDLLLLLDFDGTLVPIAPTPDAIEVPGQLSGLIRRLEARGDRVWIVTGRPSRFVAERVPGARVVGLHGLQWPDRPDPARASVLDDGVRRARELAADFPGMLVEDKGLSLGLHTRQVPPDRHADAWDAARRLADAIAAGDPSLNVLEGHEVVEIRPRAANKAAAVCRLVDENPGLRPLYVGDDTTDEEAFAALPEGAISIRVGPPGTSTLAAHRVPDVPSVYALLATLAAR